MISDQMELTCPRCQKRYTIQAWQQSPVTLSMCDDCHVRSVGGIPVADVQKVIEELEERRDAGIGKRVTYNFVIHRLQTLLPKEED